MTAKRSGCPYLKFNKTIQSIFIEGPLCAKPDVCSGDAETKVIDWPSGSLGELRVLRKQYLRGTWVP